MANKPAPDEKESNLLVAIFKEIKNIIAVVSTWLILLSLIVVIFALFIIIAMWITPTSYTWYPVYPFSLLFLLLVIIIGIFIDRFSERAAKTKIDLVRYENSISIEQKKVTGKESAVVTNFSDTRLGFNIYAPEIDKWKKPAFLTYKQLLIYFGAVPDNDKADDTVAHILVENPFGEMYKQSENVLFQFGETIQVAFNKDSSTPFIEEYFDKLQQLQDSEGKSRIPDDKINAERIRRVSGGGNPFPSLKFPVGLCVQVLDKRAQVKSVSKPTLANLITGIIAATREPVEQISSDTNGIVAVTRIRFLNVKADGQSGNFSIYRMYKLVENQDKVYFLQIQWTPESDSAPEVWDELKKMLDSFTII